MLHCQKTRSEIFATCDYLGESAVRVTLNWLSDTYEADKRIVVEEWLRLREHESGDKASNRSNGREAETVPVANHLEKIPSVATIFAAVASIGATIILFMSSKS